MTKRLMALDPKNKTKIVEIPLITDIQDKIDIQCKTVLGEIGSNYPVTISSPIIVSTNIAFEGGAAFEGHDFGLITGTVAGQTEYYYNLYYVKTGETAFVTLPDGDDTTGNIIIFQLGDDEELNQGQLRIDPVSGDGYTITVPGNFVEFSWMDGEWYIIVTN